MFLKYYFNVNCSHFNCIAKIFNYYLYIYIFNGAQTSVCVTNYVHISTLYRLTTFMFICQTVNSDRFLETLFCTRSFTSLLRFGSLNTLLTLPVEKDCKTSHSRGETGDIILLHERFIQNVASCYVLCLKKESINTGSCARVCVRYYDISSKVDRGDIFIVHDQKSSYRTPPVPQKKKLNKT